MAGGPYEGLIKRWNDAFDEELKRIEVKHNFELGEEFEVALCRVLRNALPQRFGICRGYIVDKAGNEAGDDLIIFDRSRFTTLRGLDADDYSLKERVPADATYAYIEAKHTVSIEGDGPQSLLKAFSQIAAAKSVMDNRSPVEMGTVIPNVGGGRMLLKPPPQPNALQKQNPPLGILFARNVRADKESAITNLPDEVKGLLAKARLPLKTSPDISVFGPHLATLSVVPSGNTYSFDHPFFVEGRSVLLNVLVQGRAFGLGLAALLWSLDLIRLGAMPWREVIVADALNSDRK